MANIKSDKTKARDEIEKARDEFVVKDHEGVANSSLESRLQALEQANADLVEQLKKKGVSSEQQSMGFAELMRELRASIDPNSRTFGKTTGKTIQVNRGEFCGYWPNQGGKGKFKGGWFKCHKDDQLSYDGPNQIAVANKMHVYDEGEGILYHQFNNTPYKLIKKDRTIDVQGDGSPRSELVAPRQFAGV